MTSTSTPNVGRLPDGVGAGGACATRAEGTSASRSTACAWRIMGPFPARSLGGAREADLHAGSGHLHLELVALAGRRVGQPVARGQLRHHLLDRLSHAERRQDAFVAAPRALRELGERVVVVLAAHLLAPRLDVLVARLVELHDEVLHARLGALVRDAPPVAVREADARA